MASNKKSSGAITKQYMVALIQAKHFLIELQTHNGLSSIVDKYREHKIENTPTRKSLSFLAEYKPFGDIVSSDSYLMHLIKGKTDLSELYMFDMIYCDVTGLFRSPVGDKKDLAKLKTAVESIMSATILEGS